MNIYVTLFAVLIVGLGAGLLLLHLGLKKNNCPALGRAVLFHLALFLYAFTLGMSGSFFVNELHIQHHISEFFIKVLMWVLVFVPVILHYRSSLAETFLLKRTAPRLLLPALLVTFGIFILRYYFQHTFRIPDFLPSKIETDLDFYSAMIYSVVISAPATEFFERGLILGILLKRYKPMHAVLIGAILSILEHEPIHYFQCASTGIFYGWAVIKTRSIWIVILSHAVLSLMIYLFKYFLIIDLSFATQSLLSNLVGVMIGIMSIILGVKLFSKWCVSPVTLK